MEKYPLAKQRQALLEMVAALKARDRSLRHDECGDWVIEGRHGRVYAVPGSVRRPLQEGFQIYVPCSSVREWSYAKKAFAPFTDLDNDGDDEGMVFLAHLPTPAEAEIIRQYTGIPKKRDVSDEERARLRSMGHRFQKQSDVEAADQDATAPTPG